MVAYQQGEKNKMSWQWVQQGHSKRKNKCTSHSGSPDQSYTSDPGCAASLAIRVTQEGGGGAVLWRVRPSQSPWGISADMATWQDALMKNT